MNNHSGERGYYVPGPCIILILPYGVDSIPPPILQMRMLRLAEFQQLGEGFMVLS